MNKCLVALSLVLCACGSDDKKTIDAPVQQHDARPIDSVAAGDAANLDAPGTAPLTVKNFDTWCSVSVNGGTASTAAVQTVNVAPGTIPLTAVALPGFKIDSHMWHYTTGDTGSGDTGTVTGTGTAAQSATTATVTTAAKCVWVCCPFPSGLGCDPVPDPCL